MNDYHIDLKMKMIEGVKYHRFIDSERDVLDLMGACYEGDINRALLYESNLNADYFDLKTGFAGQIMQKFATYRFKVAFVISRDRLEGKFGKFVQEANKGQDFRFFFTRFNAIEWLASQW